MTTSIPNRFHRYGYGGWSIPGTALVGGSYTGEWEDSPAKYNDLDAEIKRFRKEVLRPLGIKSRTRWGKTCNIFCAKRWVCVSPEDFYRARAATLGWLSENDAKLRILHDANLNDCREA